MTDHLVPAVRTHVTLDGYARAAVKAWRIVGEGVPAKASIAVLWAQYMIETGNRDAWGWNIGNTKEVPNDGIDYHALNGVWEGASEAEAERLIAAGQATRDPSPEHAHAVGPGKVSVIFAPSHPASWFSDFPSLDAAMEHHLVFLARRFAPAWPAVLGGDYVKFAHVLGARGYFTANPDVYAGGMHSHFDAFMKSTAYEDLIAELATAEPAIDLTAPALEDDGGAARRDATSDAIEELAHAAIAEREAAG